MGRNFYKLKKLLMTSSPQADFMTSWLNSSKTVKLIFTKLFLIFRQSYMKVFEMKRLEIGYSLLPW